MPPLAAPGAPGAPTGVAPDPLAELRDIHLPGSLDAWPPAPGWWILGGVALLTAMALIIWLYRRWRSNRYRREAMAELRSLREDYDQHGDDARYLDDYQALLKRVALTRFSREDVASLTGESWVAFLDRTCGGQEFTMGKGQILIDAQYQPEPVVDVEALHELGAQWIRRHHDHTDDRRAA
jgi:hypothetical protein